MLYAFLSDIHANYDALTAVLAQIDAAGPAEILCGGDLIGYGAQPAQCVAELRHRKVPSVAGNHDFAAAGETSIDYFNPEAQLSVRWTRSMLSPADTAYLRGLPLLLQRDAFLLFHGTLAAPQTFDYILSPYDAAASFQLLDRPVAFFGHSHVPGVFLDTSGVISYHDSSELVIPENARALINVGSVGQPRDNNPLAGYTTYDTDTRTITLCRVEYDVDAALHKILDAGLPEMNAYRLILGR